MAEENRNARLIQRGDIVHVTVGPDSVEEVVRDVGVVLSLSDGNTVSIPADSNVLVVVPEPLPAAVVAQVDEMLRPVEEPAEETEEPSEGNPG